MSFKLRIVYRIMNKERLKEFIRFCIIGVVATFIHYGIYYALIKCFHVEKELWLNIAYTIGYLVSFGCNLWLTAHYTFKTQVNLKRAIGFAASHGVNYVLHLAFLNLFLWMGLAPTIAPWLVFCCVVPINFILVMTVFKRI